MNIKLFFLGDFHCSCPAGFTGKTCQLRGDWDPCVTAQCGHGECIRQKNSFTCKCVSGWSGPFCNEPAKDGEDLVATGNEENEDGMAGNWLWLTEMVENEIMKTFKYF